MKNEDSVIIIPARLGSTRLFEKVLADINGIPMIIHILKRAQAANIANVFVATESNQVADLVEKNGGNAILTSDQHQSGTDRVYEALQKINNPKYKYVINLQGDMPNIKSYIIQNVLDLIKSDDKIDISTAIYKMDDEKLSQLPHIVNAIISYNKEKNAHRALYFSRSSVPYGDSNKYSHLGIYGYNINSIKKFVNLQQSSLELSEKLEQLRALEAGMSIFCSIVDDFPISVDIMDDLINARKIMIDDKI